MLSLPRFRRLETPCGEVVESGSSRTPPRIETGTSLLLGGGLHARRPSMSKSADKPKKQLKKKPQRTLKERRSEKRATKKLGSGSLRSE